jgi:hypothetical protein
VIYFRRDKSEELFGLKGILQMFLNSDETRFSICSMVYFDAVKAAIK